MSWVSRLLKEKEWTIEMKIRDTRYQGTKIDRPPHCYGIAGQGWRMVCDPPGQRGRRDWDATIAVYVVRVPGAHIAWDHWSISVVHLRPIEGVKDPTITLAGATHELVIAALDPGEPLPVNLTCDGGWKFLLPIDVVEQFEVKSDADALAVLELAVQAIVDGLASPDQDWRRWWYAAIKETAKHYRERQTSGGSVH